jgi:hypothetical protein
VILQVSLQVFECERLRNGCSLVLVELPFLFVKFIIDFLLLFFFARGLLIVVFEVLLDDGVVVEGRSG